MNWLFLSGGQSFGALVSASVLPMSIQGWFPLGWTGWISLLSKGLSRIFSKTTVPNHQFFSAQPSLEKATATHSSTLAWQIPWTEEPGRLQSMGSLGVGYNWATSLSLFTFMRWRRKWQPTPVVCLENPRDGQAWWATVHRVTKSQTQLRQWQRMFKLLHNCTHLTC